MLRIEFDLMEKNALETIGHIVLTGSERYHSVLIPRRLYTRAMFYEKRSAQSYLQGLLEDLN